MYQLYRFLTRLTGPFLPLLLDRRRAAGKEDASRIRERLGHASLLRPAGSLVWIHAASVGESASVLPLIDALLSRYPRLSILITTVTVTSAQMLANRLPPRAIHQFAPLDHPDAVDNFLSHWRPNMALWVESELWPNMVISARATGCSMTILGGRMSEKSFRLWQRFPGLAARMLACFKIIFAQSEADATRFTALGAPHVIPHGNLKYDAPPLPADAESLATLRNQIGDRPLWLAASTHPGEEEQIAAIHAKLITAHPTLLTVIVPRHAVRGPEIAQNLRALGVILAQRSKNEIITSATGIYLADSMGELGLFYRLAPIVMIGGTLVPHGGQNPLEPARLHCAIIAGPHMENFIDIATEMESASALLRVTDANYLAHRVEALLNDPPARERLAESALAYTAGKTGILNKILANLSLTLDTLA